MRFLVVSAVGWLVFGGGIGVGGDVVAAGGSDDFVGFGYSVMRLRRRCCWSS